MDQQRRTAPEEVLLQNITLPEMYRIRQNFARSKIEDVSAVIEERIVSVFNSGLIRSGMSIAIAVGSRGINNIAEIVRAAAVSLKEKGAVPFIVPAMGSHGNASVSGQIEILHSYGVREDFVQAPIRATADAVKIGKTESGYDVFLDAEAVKADGIIVVNRIKPHTAFSNSIESGLLKMAVVGLGKQVGARSFHSGGMENMAKNLMEMGKIAMDYGKILFGLAIIENAYDETADIVLVQPEDFFSEEPELLKCAKAFMPELPVKKIDVLIIDEIGKDISGDSMDPNITGRFYSPAVQVHNKPEVQRIVCLDLSEGSHGNCIGVGVADFITKKLYEKIDFSQIYINALTNCVLEPAKTPLVMRTSELAVKAALASCLHIDMLHPRIVHIKNTLSLEYAGVSKAVLDDIKEKENIEIV